MTFIADMNIIYSMRSLKVAGAQTFVLLEVECLTFIPIKVRLLLFRKNNIDFFFPFLSLLCDTVRGCCWMIASIIVLVRRSSIKVLRYCSYAVLSWETDDDVFFFEHQRRRRICFKEIVTPHGTRLHYL